jgi:hypothetical protein
VESCKVIEKRALAKEKKSQGYKTEMRLEKRTPPA